MRNKYLYLMGFLFLFVLAGCSNNDSSSFRGSPDITGYVVSKNEQTILVTSSEPEDLSNSDGLEEYYDVISASDAPENVQVGDEVNLWYKGDILESYPAQTSVGKLEIIPSSTPEGATLTESDALSKALSQNEFENNTLVIQSIAYQSDEDIWSIKFKDLIFEDEEGTVQVKDK